MLLILSSQSVLSRNPFSGSKLDLAPRANLFKLSFGRGICGIDDCQWQHFPSLTSYFWFSTFQLDQNTRAYFFSSFLKKNFFSIRKRPLADVFLLVLSQFRQSHIRPLGAIYSLIGFCMCSAQTFLTVGHLIIMDRHHGDYGTHTPHMWNRCYSLLHHQTSRSPEQTSSKENINNRNRGRGWRGCGPLSTCPTEYIHTQTHKEITSMECWISFNPGLFHRL